VRITLQHPVDIADLHFLQDFTRPFVRLFPVPTQAPDQSVGDLSEDSTRRIERGHRILRDHGGPGSDQLSPFPVGQGAKVLSIEPDCALDHFDGTR